MQQIPPVRRPEIRTARSPPEGAISSPYRSVGGGGWEGERRVGMPIKWIKARMIIMAAVIAGVAVIHH